MGNLNVVDLFEKADNAKVNNFADHVSSELKVVTDYDKIECNYEWLEIMEDTIRYIDNILRNPNRFIVNEEDIIKVELAKKIGVESIKHLSRNTNLIQDYNKKTGDVRPSKILNINKEESFDTYENRFIYSLIQNMKMYIQRKKSGSVLESKFKNNKKFEYSASTNVGEEKVNISMSLDTKLNTSLNKNTGDNNLSIEQRIEKLELRVKDLCSSQVYMDLAKKHIALVTSPIKKTNMILKNVNFQYALDLWNYMQENIDENGTNVKEKKDYNDNGDLKKYIDETMMLNYLVMSSLNKDSKKEEINKEEVSEKLIANMVSKVLDVNESLSEEQLKNIVSKQYAVIKYKNIENDMEIQRRFKKHLNEYIKKVSEAELI